MNKSTETVLVRDWLAIRPRFGVKTNPCLSLVTLFGPWMWTGYIDSNWTQHILVKSRETLSLQQHHSRWCHITWFAKEKIFNKITQEDDWAKRQPGKLQWLPLQHTDEKASQLIQLLPFFSSIFYYGIKWAMSFTFDKQKKEGGGMTLSGADSGLTFPFNANNLLQ